METQNSGVLTQNDINKVIDGIASNASMVTDTIKIITSSMTKILGDADKLNTSVSDFKSLSSIINSYMDIVQKVIKTLCMDLPGGEGSDLTKLLGRIESQETTSDGKLKNVVKYTVIDAAMQIPQIIDAAFDVLEKLRDFNTAFNTMFKVKKNIKLLKAVITDVFQELVNAFSDIVTKEDVDKLMKSLVKQPDIVSTMVETNAEYNKGQLHGKDLSTSLTETKQGQLGLLDIFAQTFSLVNTLNDMKVPGPAKIMVKLVKLRIALRFTLGQIIKFYENLLKRSTKSGKTPSELINEFGELIVGKGREGEKDHKVGLFGLVQKLNLVISTLKEMKIGPGQFLILWMGIKFINVILNEVILIINDNKLAALANDKIDKRIDRVNKNIMNLTSIVKNLTIMGLLSLPFLVFGLLIPVVIRRIGKIIDSINTHLAKKEIENTSILSDLEEVMSNMVSVSKKIIIVGLLSIPVIISSLAIAAMVAVGYGAVLLSLRLFNLIATPKLMLDIKMKMTSFEATVKSLVITGLLIVALALLSPYIIKAIVYGFIPMMMSLVLMAGIMWIMSKVLSRLTLTTLPNILVFGVSIAIIIGTLLASALLIFIVAKMQQNLEGFDAWGKVVSMLLGMIALTAIITLLGLGLAALAPVYTGMMLGFGQILATFGMLLGIGLLINTLAGIELKIGDEKTEGTARYTIRQILDCVAAIRDMLNEENEDGTRKVGKRKRWKKDKKLLKNVDASVKEIVDIAKRLNYLQSITIDKEALLGGFKKDANGNLIPTTGSIGTIFDTINLIEDALTNFNKESGKGLTYRRDQVKTRKRMRRNKRVLSKVDRVINKLVDITEGISEIQSFNIDKSTFTTISNNIGHIFEVVEKIDGEIKLRNTAAVKTESGEIVSLYSLLKEKRLARRNKKIAKHNSKSMTAIGQTMSTLADMIDAIESIKEFSWKDENGQDIKDEAITGKIGIIFKTLNLITGSINTEIEKAPKTKDVEKLESIVNYISSFGDGAKGIAEVDSEKLGKNIDHYIRFVDNINSIEVQKIETATNMFKQMSDFSNSIKGDFDQLAESLGDKLVPMLEKLKEVMETIPEKIESSTSNISSSIGAIGSASTEKNITAQVDREIPNATPEEKAKIVHERLKENAKTQQIASKIDEVINLLSGKTVASKGGLLVQINN